MASPAPRVNLGNAFERGQMSGAAASTVVSSAERGVELALVEQRAAERGASGGVFGVEGEAGPAGLDRLAEPAGAPEFLGEGGKSKRRRILLDPASQLLNARAVRHDGQSSPTA